MLMRRRKRLVSGSCSIQIHVNKLHKWRCCCSGCRSEAPRTEGISFCGVQPASIPPDTCPLSPATTVYTGRWAAQVTAPHLAAAMPPLLLLRSSPLQRRRQPRRWDGVAAGLDHVYFFFVGWACGPPIAGMGE